MAKYIETGKAPGVAVHVTDNKFNPRADIVISATEGFGSEATLARELVCRWGMVAGLPDGEDTSGRQKLQLLSPEEVVNRSCDIAALTMAALRERGWVAKIPNPTEAYDIIEASSVTM